MSIIDINEAASLVMQAADGEANIIFGAGIDNDMDDEVRITVIATGFEKTPFPPKEKSKGFGADRDWTRAMGGQDNRSYNTGYNPTPLVHQEYPSSNYDDMSFNGAAEEEYQGGAYGDNTRNIPTPAAMPPMMQPYQGSYNAGYQQQGYGQQMGTDYSMANNYFNVAFWFANGCTLFGANGTDISGSTFNGAEGLAVAKYIATLKAAGLENINDGDATTALTNGTLAAQVTGSWKATDYKTALGDNYGVAPLPTIKIDGTDKQMVSFSGVKLYVVKSSTKYPEAAMQLADFLSNQENQLKAFNDRGNLPINIVAASDPAVTADATVAAQVAQSANSIPMPSVPQMTNFWSATSMAVTKEIYDGTTTDFQAALDGWQALLSSDVAA